MDQVLEKPVFISKENFFGIRLGEILYVLLGLSRLDDGCLKFVLNFVADYKFGVDSFFRFFIDDAIGIDEVAGFGDAIDEYGEGFGLDSCSGGEAKVSDFF